MGPSEDRSYADPFLFRRDGRTFLFLEEIRHPGRKGTIAYTELDAAGNWQEPQTILSADYHLSYPFVFEWEGDVYLLPESSAHRTLELYRAVEFPGKWKFDRVVMDNIFAVDATIRTMTVVTGCSSMCFPPGSRSTRNFTCSTARLRWALGRRTWGTRCVQMCDVPGRRETSSSSRGSSFVPARIARLATGMRSHGTSWRLLRPPSTASA